MNKTMNKNMRRIATSFIVAGVMMAVPMSANVVKAEEITYGSSATVNESTFTLEEMLTYAIQDEYLAKAEYQAIMTQFETTRPYSNIMLAEDVHIQELLPLFAAYSVEVPVNDAAAKVILPETLQETYSIGVQAEINNIAMYDKFLAQELPEDVRDVFEQLKAASEKHLSAFERANTGTGMGGGRTSATRGKGTAELGNATQGNTNQGNSNRGNTNRGNAGTRVIDGTCIFQ